MKTSDFIDSLSPESKKAMDDFNKVAEDPMSKFEETVSDLREVEEVPLTIKQKFEEDLVVE